MNPLTKSKFFVSCLNASIAATPSIDLFYHDRCEAFVHEILPVIPPVTDDLDAFYGCALRPRISVFVYPDRAAMSEAFGRELKSDQWCFVPITGDHALVTFTANIRQESLAHILIHEFSHIYFAQITGSKEISQYRVSIPLWLDEGIAFHLDRQYRQNFAEIRQNRLAALQSTKNDYFPNLMELYTYYNRLDEEEFGTRAEKAYAFSFICVEELIEEFGVGYLSAFLRTSDLDTDFEAAFASHFGYALSAFNDRMTEKYGPATATSAV